MFVRRLSTSTRNIAFAFDIDGVLIRGSKSIPQAQPALSLLNQRQIPWILLTNGGGKSESQRVADLSSRLGNMPISEQQFMQSHTPFRDLTNKYNRVLVVGGDGNNCRHVAKEYGFKNVVITADIINQVGKGIWPFHRFTEDQLSNWTDDPSVDVSHPFDAVLVFNDPRDMGTDTQIILELLLSKNGQLGTRRLKDCSKPAIPIHFSNNDLLWANSYNLPRFGQGAFRICIESLYREMTGYDLERTIIGKPFKPTYDYAHKLLGSWSKGPLETVYMVGDNPASDIAGANAYGWKSMLVRTGVYKDSDIPIAKPDYIFDNVLDAVKHATN